MKVWVLTRGINEYNQDGEYYENVFANKPTAKQLIDCGVHAAEVEHVLKGGGRTKHEYYWFFLREEDCT